MPIYTYNKRELVILLTYAKGGLTMKVKRFFTVGVIVFILSFLLLFFGVKVMLEQDVTGQNILAYAILSIMFGGISGAAYILRMKATFFIFLGGLIIGFTMMYTQFSKNMDGWGDLTGLMSLFFAAGIGLIAGLVVQGILHLVRKK